MRVWMLLAALALGAGKARAQDVPAPIVLPLDRIVALGAAAEAECAATLRPRCLAAIALSRAAAAQGPTRAIRPVTASAAVIEALHSGEHIQALRSLLILADAVRRIPPAGNRSPELWDMTTRLRAGQVAEVRAILEHRPDLSQRAVGLRDLAIRTLDPLVIGAAVPAANGHPDEAERRIALGWGYGLALAGSGERDGLEAWLQDLAEGPDFTEDANGNPSGGSMTIFGNGFTSLTTDRGAYLGPRNLPRLAAYAWALIGDGPQALAAADRIRWAAARVSVLEAIGQYRRALRPAADARIVAAGEAEPDNGGIRAAVLRAMIRLSMLEEAEERLTGPDARDALEAPVPLLRLLVAAHARAGDAAAVDRIVAWAGRTAREQAEAERNPRGREERLRRASEVEIRLRLAGLWAQPSRQRDARALLAEHAAPPEVEACAARGGACLPMQLLLQAVAEAPAEAR